MSRSSDLFDETSLLAEARKQSGFEDFGDEDFRDPLRALLRSLDEEARLNGMGRAAQRARILGLLVSRLRARHWLVRHPEILDERIEVRFVVVGFPRTGTTLLQRLLACDPRTTSLKWWESRNPAPLPGWSPESARSVRDPRIADAEEQIRVMLEHNPELAAVHPLEAEAPDEDLMLLEHAFQSSTPAAFANVPGYLRWHLEQDGRPAYQDHERFLQLLQWQKRQRGEPIGSWVLKAPHHMIHLDLVFEHYPEATVVQTHRDPLETLPSLASMSFELRRLASDDVDPLEVAFYAELTARHRIDRLLEVRRAMPEARFLDVWFGDVVSDPIAEVERIYDHVGLDLTLDVRRSMKSWIEANRRDQRPSHEYTLEQFGFTPERIRREFAEYREAYVIPRIGAPDHEDRI
jgi:hypothetical protein